MAPLIGVHDSVEAMFPPAAFVDALEDLDVDVRSIAPGDDLDGLDGVVTFDHDPGFLGEPPAWIHSTQAGVNRIPVEALLEAGVVVTSSNGIHGDVAGETAVGYMLMLARRLHDHVRAQLDREWAPPAWDEPFSLTGEPVCVVGLGTLGRGIARAADGIGMDVTGVRRTPLPVGHVREVFTPETLVEAIAPARFVALAVPLTDRTERMIGAAELEAMREDAYLVNIARGAVVDETALAEALEAGTIAGAALDVFETEPLPPDSPLWDLEDVIVSPHEATDHREKHRDVARLVAENARRLAAGEALANRLG